MATSDYGNYRERRVKNAMIAQVASLIISTDNLNRC